jgi:uncharacterized protein YjdB
MKKQITLRVSPGQKSGNLLNTGRFSGRLRSTLLMLTLGVALLSSRASAQGTWTQVTNYAPHYNQGVMLLLTDGTIMCKTSSGGTYGTTWDKLTPNSAGSYIGGTWSTLAAMHDDRLYFSTQVLQDGRVYAAGGEYGAGGVKSEVYNPATNTWTQCPQIVTAHPISDANSELLPNGKVLQAVVDTFSARLNYLYNPATNTYSPTGTCLRVNNEASWLKLPDQSILFVDNYGTTSERYIPATNTWVNDGTVPVSLYDAFGSEAGGAFLLPDGRGFFIGATNHTAFYTPSGTTSAGTWSAGPDIPGTQGSPDAASAMMVNGKILMAVSPVPTSADHFPPPTAFYEFDYTTNTFTLVSAPGGGTSLTGDPCFITNMLCLPDGKILYATQGDTRYYVYTPDGTPLTAGKPTVDNVFQTGCNTFMVTGKLFNGIGEGAAYGDDWQMSTNYPIIRINSGSTVYYANSYNWNRTGVMTGTALDTAYFTTPGAVTAGTYSLVVTANGNASSNYTFTPGPAAISPATVSICGGATTTLTDATSGGTWSSSSTAIATVGSTGIVTGISGGTANITYSVGSCFATRIVTVSAPGAISGGGAYCAGVAATLTSSPAGGTWSSGNTSVATIVSTTGVVSAIGAGTSIISYTVSGCRSMTTVTVNALPTAYTVTGGGSYCSGGAGVPVGLSGSTSGIIYQAYVGAAPVGSSATGTGAALSLGNQVSANTYSVTGTNSTTGCVRAMTGTVSIVINPVPSAISGTTSVLEGMTSTLSDATSGGSWSSSNATIASVGATTGVVTGVAPGTVAINYTLPTGCATSTGFTVTSSSSISGNPELCIGSFSTLTDTASGGTWSSSNPFVASVDAGGNVSAMTAGTTTISYVTSTATATLEFTVDGIPSSISGTTTLCAGSFTSLFNSTTGGTWIANDAAIATIDIHTGNLTSVSAGTTIVSYTMPGGCYSTTTILVNPLPFGATIDGGGSYCAGGAGVEVYLDLSQLYVDYTLYNGSTYTGIDVMGSAGGDPVSFGLQTAPGTYTVHALDINTSCTSIMPGSRTVSITSGPAAIVGVSSLMAGATAGLTDATAGGSWSSSDNSIATVGSFTGSVTAIAAGVVDIQYTLSGGCSVTHTITVNPGLSSSSGSTSICVGSTSTFTNALSGGVWSTSNNLVASVGASTGVVTGVAIGTATITYLYSSSSVTTVVTIYPVPAVITGGTSVCVDASITLGDATPGGAWSGGGSFAIVDPSTGVVTGASAGTTTITYTLPTGCFNTLSFTAKPLPTAIAGTTAVCVGSYTILTDATPVGVSWTSDNTSVATIGSGSGVLTGIAAGTANITYTINTGCTISTVATVNTAPSAISGTATICMGSSSSMTATPTGGAWSSSNTAVATVDASGTVTGSSAGTARITYSLGGCVVMTTVSINALPSAISAVTVCAGSTGVLSATPSGGTWSSDNVSVATINSTGLLTGIAMGTANISYTLSTGCASGGVATISSGPAAISGATSTCVGATTLLSDATSGGSWTSSTTSVAIVGTGGVVSGVASGTAIITYAVGVGCRSTVVVSVLSTLPAITGATGVCVAASTTLSNSFAGGTWSSSNTAVATIDPSTGVVDGISAGTITITYSYASCFKTSSFTVRPLPAAIAGATSYCVGGTGVLTDPTSGGLSWTSSNTSVATIGVSSGVVTAISAGTSIMTFTLTTGCATTTVVSVSSGASAISGSSSICVGSTTIVTSPDAGGAWSSSGATIASVNAAGLVTGLNAGAVNITYLLSGGCRAIFPMTINASPAAIGGSTTICTGSTTALTDATTGGAWTSSDATVASVSGTGVVTGVATGMATISYTKSGCARTVTINVSAGSAAISGSTTICPGTTSLLSSAASGGAWSTSSGSVATISSGGLVTGVAVGTSRISYTVAGGCSANVVVSVIAAPAIITGTNYVCLGNMVSLSDATTGGAWSSSNATLGTIDAGTGVLTGLSAGTTVVSYSIGTCSRTLNVTVRALPVPITGNLNICVGGYSVVTDASPTGVAWSTSTPSIATIGTGSGVVTGVSVGTTTITYLNSTTCVRTAVVTVNPALTAGTISGPSSVSLAGSIGSPVGYTDAATGGTWTSSNTARATIGAATGLLTGVSAGALTISYTVTNSCGTVRATQAVTITTPRAAGNLPGNEGDGMLQLYPNPTSGIFTLQSSVEGTFTVYTIEGKKVEQYQVSNGVTTLSLPKGIATGVYMCKFLGNDGSTMMVRLVYE